MKKLILRPMAAGIAALALLALLSACGSTPEPTEPPPSQTPWVVIVTSTSGATREAGVQPTDTLAPTRQATARPTEAPTQAPTQTSAPAETAVSAEETPSPTAAAATTAAAEPSNTPRPTSTEASFAIKYPPPQLLEPSNNQPISWQGTMTFIWAPVGDLAEDEYYVLEFYRPPKTAAIQPWGDFIYLKETAFVWEGSFKDPFHLPEVDGDAVVEWWVRVAHKTGEDSSGKPIGIDISAPSERRTVILRPKPEGQ